MAALEHFALYCENEKNPAIKEMVYSKMREYRRRAEYLKTAIEQPSQWDDSTRLKSFKEQGIGATCSRSLMTHHQLVELGCRTTSQLSATHMHMVDSRTKRTCHPPLPGFHMLLVSGP